MIHRLCQLGWMVLMVSLHVQVCWANENTNRLAKEKSPYLLQHAHNPVDWFPWGEEAFAKARSEDKPIFLSIGYSTCHWCHVMAQESFENPQIAAILNKHFVAIKVDREERPDVDHIYMQAVLAMTASGGWPLSVFLTPDGKPFSGGTYFPPESRWGKPGFSEILTSVRDLWTHDRAKAIHSARAMTEALGQTEDRQKSEGSAPLDEETLQEAFRIYQRSFDEAFAGFGSAPKFPMAHNLSFLLRYWKRTQETKALVMVEKTLQAMAEGGIYDHLGGGFHRYATDRIWQVPHFEKMLYDQAMMARVYLEAYQVTGKTVYAQVAREVLEYVLRDMRDRQGGFYCAQDADSLDPGMAETMTLHSPHETKKEGAYYLWSYDEIVNILGEKAAAVFGHYYGLEQKGNIVHDPHQEFGAKNIIWVRSSLKATAERFQMTVGEVQDILKQAKAQLLTVRSKRPRPHLDDKILVDWNGLMISTLALASQVLEDPRYEQAAEQAAQFIFKRLRRSDGRLLHRFRDGEAGILGTLDDYAFFIHGLLDLYEVTFKIGYLREARQLTTEMIRLFWDQGRGGFYLTGVDGEKLLMRPREVYDGAIPSGNSVAAHNLLRLSRMTLEEEGEAKAAALMKAFSKEVNQGPAGYAQLLMALDFALGPSKEIMIVGDREDPLFEKMIKILYQNFLPNRVIVQRPVEEAAAEEWVALIPFFKKKTAFGGKATAYVCENYTCKKPTNDLKEYQLFLGISH
jgi:uncharacterized protein YyaL (SSP411 family)